MRQKNKKMNENRGDNPNEAKNKKMNENRGDNPNEANPREKKKARSQERGTGGRVGQGRAPKSILTRYGKDETLQPVSTTLMAHWHQQTNRDVWCIFSFG